MTIEEFNINKILMISILLILMASILVPTVHAEYPVTKDIDIQGSIWSWVPVKIVTAPENYPSDYYPIISIENGIFIMDTPFNSEAYIERYFDIPISISTLSMEVWGAINMGGWCGEPVTTTISLIDSDNNIYQLGYFVPVQRNNNTGPGEIKNFDLNNFAGQKVKIRIDQTSNGKACVFGNYKDIRLLTTIKPIQNPPIDKIVVQEGKFRVGPTVRIRPLNDIISKDQDGLVELYMDNPSLNNIVLSVDIRISAPSGVHIYGEGFGEAGVAGMVYGKFEVFPGSARTIKISIRSDNVEDFLTQFSGMYWPGDNKDAYQPISLTHPFKVSNPQEEKFRVGPTVRIRPLNDVISRDQDGLVELYMDNPSLNNVSLTVDIRISLPSGIHVYGQGFGEAGAAGMVYGKFDIPPGSARTINIQLKITDNIEDFSAQFIGMYWPGNNKDAYQPISLTHPFKISLPPTETIEPEQTFQYVLPINIAQETILLSSIIFIVIIIIIYLFNRNRRQQWQQHAADQNLPNGRKRICPRCGWQNDKDSNFCTDCGFRFKG